MTFWTNIIILVTTLGISWIHSRPDDLIYSFDRVLPLFAIPFLGSIVLPIFFGTIFGIFARGRTLLRPSMHKLLIARNSPLQFFWFGGMIFCAAGIGQIAGYFGDGISSDGVTIVAGGLGLLTGSSLIVRIFSTRFRSPVTK
jgi:hypothetical protein